MRLGSLQTSNDVVQHHQHIISADSLTDADGFVNVKLQPPHITTELISGSSGTSSNNSCDIIHLQPPTTTVTSPMAPTHLSAIQSDFARYSVPSKPKPHLEVLFSITEICDLIASHLYIYDVLNLRQTSKCIKEALADTALAYRDVWVIGPASDFLKSYRAFVDGRYSNKNAQLRKAASRSPSLRQSVSSLRSGVDGDDNGKSQKGISGGVSPAGMWRSVQQSLSLRRTSPKYDLRHLSKARCEEVRKSALLCRPEAIEIWNASYPTQHHIRNIFSVPVPEFSNIRSLIFDGWDSTRISLTEILLGLQSLRGRSRLHETMETLSVRYAVINRRNLLSLGLWEKWLFESAKDAGWELFESSDSCGYFWQKEALAALARNSVLTEKDLIPREELDKLRPFALKNFYYYTPHLMDQSVIRMVLYTPPFPTKLLKRLRISSDVSFCECWYIERPGLTIPNPLRRQSGVTIEHDSAEICRWRCIYGPGGCENTSSTSSSLVLLQRDRNYGGSNKNMEDEDVEGRGGRVSNDGLPKCRDGQQTAICRKCIRWRACWKCERIVCLSCMANNEQNLDTLLMWGWPTVSLRDVQAAGAKPLGGYRIQPLINAGDKRELYCRGCRAGDPGWVDAADIGSSQLMMGDVGGGTTVVEELPGPEAGWVYAATQGARREAREGKETWSCGFGMD